MSETGVQKLVRYLGALLCRQRCTVMPILYWIRSGTPSQCRSSCRSSNKPRSNSFVPVTRSAVSCFMAFLIRICNAEVIMLFNFCIFFYYFCYIVLIIILSCSTVFYNNTCNAKNNRLKPLSAVNANFIIDAAVFKMKLHISTLKS